MVMIFRESWPSMTLGTRAAAWILALMIPIAARAETPEEWITLGARVHGGFGSFIPVGIRIGLDALQRLDAGAERGLRPCPEAGFKESQLPH